MIMDSLLEFSVKQTVLASGASTNSIDLTTTGRDVGLGEDVDLMVLLTTAMAGAGATLQCDIQTSDDVTFGTGVTTVAIGTFAALSPAGSSLIRRLPIQRLNRYVRVYFTVAGGTLTAAAVSSFIVIDVQRTYNYPSNYQIS